MSNNDAVIEFLFNQLQQQLTNNPYKQQCEDLAHEVLSLKNQLRDMSELVDELLGTITLINEDFDSVTNRGGPLPKGKSYVVGGHGPEQSGCRKEDAQECEHVWNRYIVHPHRKICLVCGVKE